MCMTMPNTTSRLNCRLQGKHRVGWMAPVNIAAFTEAITAWAAARTDIVGVAVVGSHARGTSRTDSDLDLVILCTVPATLLDGSLIGQTCRLIQARGEC
jgi:hypothetical protein